MKVCKELMFGGATAPFTSQNRRAPSQPRSLRDKTKRRSNVPDTKNNPNQSTSARKAAFAIIRWKTFLLISTGQAEEALDVEQSEPSQTRWMCNPDQASSRSVLLFVRVHGNPTPSPRTSRNGPVCLSAAPPAACPQRSTVAGYQWKPADECKDFSQLSSDIMVMINCLASLHPPSSMRVRVVRQREQQRRGRKR